QAADELDIVRMGTARVRIDQLPSESQAVKEVALNGGGPSQPMTAVAPGSSGRRPAQPAPAPAAAHSPPPPPPPPAAPPPPAPAPPGPPAPAAPAGAPGRWTTPSAPPEAVPVSTRATAGGPTVSSLVAGNALHPVGGFYVQTGAFSTPENAERQRDA